MRSNIHLRGTFSWAAQEMVNGMHCVRADRYGRKCPILLYTTGKFRRFSDGMAYEFRAADYVATDWCYGSEASGGA